MERAVQTLKKPLKKSIDSSLQTQLSRFLFKYKITPHATTGIPPSELLMNRHLRSHLDLLHPNFPAQVQQKREKQKNYHDQHSQQRDFKEGERVSVKIFQKVKHGFLELLQRGKVKLHIMYY